MQYIQIAVIFTIEKTKNKSVVMCLLYNEQLSKTKCERISYKNFEKQKHIKVVSE